MFSIFPISPLFFTKKNVEERPLAMGTIAGSRFQIDAGSVWFMLVCMFQVKLKARSLDV